MAEIFQNDDLVCIKLDGISISIVHSIANGSSRFILYTDLIIEKIVVKWSTAKI